MTNSPNLSTEQKINRFRKRAYDAIHRNGQAERIQHAKNKLTARERIAALVDPDTWYEMDLLATNRASAFGLDAQRIPTDGVITGWGKIGGRRVFIFSHDASVMGGSLGEVFAEKVSKLMDLARSAGCPCIGINDSGGARIQEGVAALGGYADIFYRNVQSSGVIPQISLIAGPCTGGAVYSPALTDFVVMVEQVGYMFITGPDVIKVTTGETVTFDELGGADVHAERSGVAHFVAETEQEAFGEIRTLLSYLPSNHAELPPAITPTDDPMRPNDALQSVVPNDPHMPYDIRVVIDETVDEGSFFEVSKFAAQNIVVGFARIGGFVIGVVANQPRVLAGSLDIDASTKAARFIRFCDAFNIPLLTFVDVPGFLPGTSQEYGGIIRHGAKLLYAYCEATVPKVTVITRKAYGGAYDVMCSKHIGGDLNYAWPTAEIAVMGAQGAANIIFKKEIQKADSPAERAKEFIDDYSLQFANPYIAAERGYIDAVIEPKQTRSVVAESFELLRNKVRPERSSRHGNIPL